MTDLFTLRPLEWEWRIINDVGLWCADAPIGNLTWRLYELTTGWELNPSGKSSVPVASPDEGKQLAEQHWQEWMKQGLVSAPETGGFTCACCGRNMEVRVNGKFCNECAGARLRLFAALSLRKE